MKKPQPLDPGAFTEVLESVREGGAILRGERHPSRRFSAQPVSIRTIRERTSLSQPDFARLIGVSVRTLQNWKQNRRRPTGPAAALLAAALLAAALLRIIDREPELAIRAIHA